MEDPELKSNLETYQAQLKQVEAALMIDEDNEELIKLKSDLQEVINLTTDLMSISVKRGKGSKQSSFKENVTSNKSSSKEAAKSDKIYEKPEERVPEKQTNLEIQQTGPADSAKRSAVVDDDDDDIDFEAMFNLPKRQATSETSNEPAKEESNTTKPKDKNIKLSREDQEKKREQRKKKLVKKQQRVKEIEEQREREKSSWQDFRKGPTKGKGKLRGLVRKSIFASPDTGIGKVGVGTCGIGGKGMTKYENTTQYIYKK